MRITFVLPYAGLAGGVRVVAIYAERLARRGHDVTVVSTPLSRPTVYKRVCALARQGRWLPNARRTGRSHFDGVPVRHHVIDRPRPIKDDDVPNADVVIATWWETAEHVAALSSAKGAKVYFVQHDERLITHDANRSRVTSTWRLPMHQITVAKWLVQMLRSEGGAECPSLVPNSVETDQFNAEPRSKASVPTFGLMYSASAFKGTDVSLRAFALARTAIPRMKLVSFGSECPTEMVPLPEGTEFSYRPPQAQIVRIYRECDAWLFGSRSEGFGLPILEAMACRTPVIATPAGAAPELISGGCGLLVKPEDPDDMARAMLRIAALPDEQWRNLSDAAHIAARRYTWDDATVLFEDVLEQSRRNALFKNEKAR